MTNVVILDYLNSLEVGQQQILALLLAEDRLLFLVQLGLHQLERFSFLA